MKKLLLASLMLASVGAYAQTKKVILHDYTGLNCGWCPEGTVIIENLQAANPNNFIPIAIHTGSYEPTSSPLYAGSVGTDLISTTGVTGFPNGSVDMKVLTGTTIAQGRGTWTSSFNTRAAMTAIVSVSFSNMKDMGSDVYEADVNVKFTSAPVAGTPLKLQVFVIEDSIAATGAIQQHNYSSSIQSGASILNPWFHNATFRKALSGDTWGWGTVIPATPVVGTTYTKHISFTKDASWVMKHVKLVAFVAYDGAASADKKEVLNAEQTSLKAFFKTGINDINTVKVLAAYPNPAHANDIVNLEVNSPESGMITMRVMNSIGQVVATPYNSNDVAGVHTVKFRASDYNLPNGMYIIQINTPAGSTSQKVNIY